MRQHNHPRQDGPERCKPHGHNRPSGSAPMPQSQQTETEDGEHQILSHKERENGKNEKRQEPPLIVKVKGKQQKLPERISVVRAKKRATHTKPSARSESIAGLSVIGTKHRKAPEGT